MRLLLVADIHANWTALQAVQVDAGPEPIDACFFLGDLVDYGLEPSPCIDWVKRHATYAVRGNHDHGAAQYVAVSGRSGFKYLTSVTRPVTQERLSLDDRRFLAALPVTRHVTIGDTRYLLVHATPRDPLDEYAIKDREFWSRRLQNVEANVICVAHTHHPYVLEVDNKLVINPGSVGQPRDGDPRASYAVITDNTVELKRIEYDVEATIHTIQESGLPEPAKALLAEVLRSGGIAKPESSRHKSEAVELLTSGEQGAKIPKTNSSPRKPEA
jgi:putative phosphoesterase